MKIAAFVLIAVVTALLSPVASWCDEKNELLIGTWKLVSAKYGGKEYQYPTGSTTLKHVTPTQFMWATYDAEGKITRAAGGTCVRNGDRYEETSQYGVNAGLNLKS